MNPEKCGYGKRILKFNLKTQCLEIIRDNLAKDKEN